MRASLLALATVLSWSYGISLLVFGFSDTATERVLDQSYPIMALIIVAGMIGYVTDALRSHRVPEPKRRLWSVVLLIGHIFAQPFYWWWYVRPRGA